MVEADHGQTAVSRVAPGVDVGLWVDHEVPRGILGEVARANRFQDLGRGADQHAAAFRGQRVARMRRDLVPHLPRDAYRYNASTAMAMPIPPPMQSDATP